MCVLCDIVCYCVLGVCCLLCVIVCLLLCVYWLSCAFVLVLLLLCVVACNCVLYVVCSVCVMLVVLRCDSCLLLGIGYCVLRAWLMSLVVVCEGYFVLCVV